MLPILFAAACGPTPETPVTPTTPVVLPGQIEKAANAVLDDWHDAAANADEKRYFGHLADDSVFLGTDATERWDKKAFQAYAHPHFAKGKAWKFKAARRTLTIAAGADVVWFDEDLTTEKLGPARGSGVLIRVGDGWKIAQYNLSIPIPNEQFDTVKKVIAGGWTAVPLAWMVSGAGRCAQAGAGAICGVVLFEGTPPTMGVPAKRKDADLCKDLPVPHNSVRTKNGHLADVVVRVVSGLKDKPTAAPTQPVELHWDKCAYTERLVAAQVGQTLLIHNRTATLNNTHGYFTTESWFNQAQPKGADPVRKELDEPKLIRITSDVHPWTHAFVAVHDHPFFGVSDADGMFVIPALPSGTYSLEAWHSIYGSKLLTVTVVENQSPTLVVRYTGTEPLAKENPLAQQDIRSFQ
ncbi:MAG: nuclear transport factor 2 family protein [Polyangiaceae bacterium]|nr:nuclear transport factor 2 family protein [Polyangiaceae bacterium]